MMMRLLVAVTVVGIRAIFALPVWTFA